MSASSVTSTKLSAKRYIGQKSGAKPVHEVTGPQAQRAFVSLFSGLPKK